MKRLVLAGLLAFFAGAAAAQTNTGNASRTTGAVSATGETKKAKTKATKNKKGKKVAVVRNPRKEYKGPGGQTATPTGHEATGIGERNAALKDTTRRGKQ